MSWNAPTTADITSSALLSRALASSMKAFILDPRASFLHTRVGRVDVGLCTVGACTLKLATNTAEFDLSAVQAGLGGRVAEGAVLVLDSGAKLEGRKVVLESVGTGAFVLG